MASARADGEAAALADASGLSGQATEVLGLLLQACQAELSAMAQESRPAARLALLLAAAQAAGSPPQPARCLAAALTAAHLTLEAAIRELGPVAAALDAPVAAVLGGGVPLERRLQLRELKSAFVFNTLLAKKARDIHAHWFAGPPDASSDAPAGLLWLVFCTARAALLPPQADLVTSFALLLACTHVLLRSARREQLRPEVATRLPPDADGLLASVAAAHGAADHEASVRQLAGLLQQLLAQVLPLPAAGAGAAADAPPALPGLLGADGRALPSTVQALQQRYRQLSAQADVDALPFLSHTPAAAGVPTPAVPTAAPAPAAVAGASPASQATASGAEAALPAQAAPAEAPAAMDVDAAAAPAGPPAGTATAFVAAAGGEAAGAEEDPGSPTAEQMTVPVAVTPRIPRVAHLTTPNPLPDASYHTPSPPKARLLPAPAPQPTPITAAMGSAAWLQGYVAAQPEGPSEALRAQMRAAGIDAAGEAALVAAAQRMAAAVLPDCTAPLEGPLLALEQSTTQARRSQGLRLYWRVVEGLVAAEAARPDAGPPAAAALLAAPLFHRCLAACALECVVASYRVVAAGFPALLERLALPAFDLCKAVEPFVQQLPSLPRDLKRHLLSVEERCLESLAWEQGSSLYPTLVAAVGAGGDGLDGGSGTDGGSASGGAADLGGSSGGARAPGPPPPPSDSPSSSNSVGGGGGGGLTPRKRVAGEMAGDGGADAAAAPPPVRPSTLGSAAAPRSAVAAAAQRQQHGQSAFDSRGRLPLSLGSGALGGGGGAARPAPGSSGAAPPSSDAAGPLAPRGDRAARAAMSEFLRRVLRLAAVRLADMLSRVDVYPADPQHLLAQAFTLAQHVAFEQTWLLYGRHLDQTLLCCLYAVCRLHQLVGASFKAIIAAYRQQPQAVADTFRNVSMRPREQTSMHQLAPTATADIILFYNQVFIPHVRPFLLRLADNRSLLVQPAPSVLPYLLPHLLHGRAAGAPSPPSPSARGAGAGAPPALAPGLPPLVRPDSPAARGLPGTPPRAAGAAAATPASSGGAASMLLLSPGAWRISRAGMTPLASPHADPMAAMRAAGGSPALLAGIRSQPATPLSSAAIHRMFGLPGATPPPPPAAAPPGALPPPPPLAAQLAADAGVQRALAGADAVASAGGGAAAAQPPARGSLLAQALPLLAAAEAAEDESAELEVAAAVASLSPPQPAVARAEPQPPLPPPPAAAAAPEAPAASPLQRLPAAQAAQAPMLSPRLARRILALQPPTAQ